jgi:hypothetical protein
MIERQFATGEADLIEELAARYENAARFLGAALRYDGLRLVFEQNDSKAPL